MIKMLLSLFRSESTEQKKVRLENETKEEEARLSSEISDIESKLTRIEKGITMRVDPEPLRKKRASLLEKLSQLQSTSKTAPQSKTAPP
jgi:hypothetical protein